MILFMILTSLKLHYFYFVCRDTLKVYSTELKNLSIKIINQMAEALKMDPNDSKQFEDGVQSMRMN